MAHLTQAPLLRSSALVVPIRCDAIAPGEVTRTDLVRNTNSLEVPRAYKSQAPGLLPPCAVPLTPGLSVPFFLWQAELLLKEGLVVTWAVPGLHNKGTDGEGT
jgi:hypothetical protein